MEAASLFVFLVMVVTVLSAPEGVFAPSSPQYAFMEPSAAVLHRAECTNDHENERTVLMRKASCSEPKEVFIQLRRDVAYETLSPPAIWVKRCVGVCGYDVSGDKCIALTKEVRKIPVRVYNLKTKKEACMTYEVEEHLSCGCCKSTPESCQSPRKFDHHKCACRCPNRKEKRHCRSKRNQIMRWNPSKCACEERRRFRSH